MNEFLTRQDVSEKLKIPVRTIVHSYALEQANEALEDLRHGRFNGAAALLP